MAKTIQIAEDIYVTIRYSPDAQKDSAKGFWGTLYTGSGTPLGKTRLCCSEAVVLELAKRMARTL